MSRLTVNEAIEALDAIDPRDPEVDHSDADDILLAAAHPDVAAAYERCERRTGPWWYA